MAKRPETRAAAATKSPSRKPASALRPAAATAKKTKAGPAERDTAKAAATAKAVAKPAKSAEAAPARKAKLGSARGASRKQATPATSRAGAAASKNATKAKPDSTAKAKAGAKAKTSKAKAKASSKPKMPRFLAAELGQPIDHDGEPIGAGSRAALGDIELQRYTMQLWRQMQSRRGVNTHIPAMERAGVTIDQIWTAGVTDRLTTSSTPEDVKRYRQKLLFRANLLESIMIETIDELQRLGTIDPTPAAATGEPG